MLKLHNQIFLSAYNIKTQSERSVFKIINDQQTRTKNKTAHGKIFEKEFFNSFPDNTFVQRMKDDTLRYKNTQNFCDYIAFSSPNLYLLELKSTKQKALPFANISQYQIDTLYHYGKQIGIIAGFVINFRSQNYQTFFVTADTMYDFYTSGGRKSFHLEWVKANGILIPSTLIRTRYRFNLSPILSF